MTDNTNGTIRQAEIEIVESLSAPTIAEAEWTQDSNRVPIERTTVTLTDDPGLFQDLDTSTAQDSNSESSHD